MQPRKRVAIYARVSSAGQRDRDLSIPEQIHQVRQFCERQGWHVVEVFEDAAKSGADTVNRPGLQRLIKAACSKARPFDLILTRELSRFGRSDEDAALRNKLREHGVSIDNISAPSGDMHANLTPQGRFMERIQSAVDIQFRETTTINMIAGQKAKARKGGLPGAQATCYGYKQEWVSDSGGRPVRTPVIDKKEAKIVREMFRRYIAGDSLKTITRWLNDSGIAAPRGVAWYDSTVRKLMSNETLLGRLVYGKVKKVKHPVTRSKINTYRDDSEVIRVDNAFPAIIDQKTFDKVQAILARNESTRPQGGHPGNTLRAIGKCAVCGWHLAHQKSSSTGRWYYMCGNVKTHKANASNPQCKGIIQADYVDEVVALFLKRIMSTSVTDIRAQVDRYNAAASNFTGLSATEALDTAIEQQEAVVSNLVNAVAKMGGSAALLKKLEEAESKLVELRRKRDALAATAFVPTVDVQSVLEARAGIKDALRAGDTAQMRALLAAIVSEVRCDWSQRKDPVVNFNYLYEAEERPTVRISSTASENREVRKFLMAHSAGVTFKKRDADAPHKRQKFSVSITVPGAPLTFVPKWSITSAERAAEEAIQQIAEALAS